MIQQDIRNENWGNCKKHTHTQKLMTRKRVDVRKGKRLVNTCAPWLDLLFEVLESLDSCDRLSDGVVSRASWRPHEIKGGPEWLVPQSLSYRGGHH